MMFWMLLAGCADTAPTEATAPPVDHLTLVHEGRGENEVEPCG